MITYQASMVYSRKTRIQMSLMTNDDYEVAKRIAWENLSDISKQIPLTLFDREKRLVETINKSGGTPLVKLERLYNFMDELYSFVAKYTPCKKGCSHCCYTKVEISAIEAEYIEKSLGIKQNLHPIASTYFGTPCPFLKDNSCSIYEYRPFVCRKHVVLFDNPKWCEIDICNLYFFPKIVFTEVDECHNLITLNNEHVQSYDIRQLFTKVV
jgi:Fe-S-cluster containining protein